MLERKLLIKYSAAMFVIGTGLVLFTFFSSMSPSEKAIANNEHGPVTVNIGSIKVGEFKIVEWRKKPIIILHRSPTDVASLNSVNSVLYDPNSLIDPDPKFIKKTQRSIVPKYFVGVAISTYCGCMLKYSRNWGDYDLPGGLFYDPCHTGVYDTAGRLLKSTMTKPVPACTNEKMSNMKIPPYKFINDTTVILGKS